VRDLASQRDPAQIDLVAGIDALGSIQGTALAPLRLGVRVAAHGWQAARDDRLRQVRGYGGRAKPLERRRGAQHPGMHVLIVDEWFETGAQAAAAITQVERQGAVVAGLATSPMDDPYG
jgi:adenine/guanine phosphoribosyltransferase-like PRPP-binding protein